MHRMKPQPDLPHLVVFDVLATAKGAIDLAVATCQASGCDLLRIVTTLQEVGDKLTSVLDEYMDSVEGLIPASSAGRGSQSSPGHPEGP